MMNRIITALVAVFFLQFPLQSQQTVGVFINEEEAMDGYMFFSPLSSTTAYLIDNCGYVINEWERDWGPGLSGYFLDNGLMLRTNDSSNNFPQASSGGVVELVDWDNKTVWSYNFNEVGVYNQHHDVAYLPNGNLLILGWEVMDIDEQREYGKEEVSGSDLWGEFIWEVRPVGDSDIEIVWEWHLKDHFVQDHDPSKSNYGVIKDNIGLVDINYAGPGWWSDRDWWHCNAIDYHEGKDQILLNSRNNNELWIIDHSTTSEQAASHTGGNSGKGGDLLYRWGNPDAYDEGDASDLRMFGSHGHYWIPEGMPNAGNILFFNNGENRPEGYYSTVEMLVPEENADGSYSLDSDNFYEPRDATLVYQAPFPYDLSSTYLSNAHQLENGNVLILEGGSGRILEVTEDQEIVWEYLSPVQWGGPAQQGESVNWNSIFRAYKFEPDFSGFDGKDLTPQYLLEGESEYEICTSSIGEINKELDLKAAYNMATSKLEISNENKEDLEIQIYSVDGKLAAKRTNSDQSIEIALENYQSGMYFLIIQNDKDQHMLKKFVIPN